MKKLILSLLFSLLVATNSFAQTYYSWRYRSAATDCQGITDGKAQDLCKQLNTGTLYVCNPTAGDCNTTGEWVVVGSGGGGAPTDATYITQTANSTLSAEQALGSLSTGLLKNTTTTGVLSIGSAGTDFASPALTLTAGAGLSGGGDLSTNRSFATDSTEANFLASGALSCGSSTQGKAAVHTTPLQYCDNAATPTLQYAAYGDSSGKATAGDSATAFFVSGALEFGVGGTGLSSASDDTTMVSSGSAWQAKALPNCTDATGNHLNYTTATNSFSCGTSLGTAGSDTQVLFNDGGVISGESGLTWGKTLNEFSVVSPSTAANTKISSALLTWSDGADTQSVLNVAPGNSMVFKPSGLTQNFTVTDTALTWDVGVAPSAGQAITIKGQSGITSGGATNLNGGNLLLKCGDSIGTGTCTVDVYATGGGTSGTSTTASSLVVSHSTTTALDVSTASLINAISVGANTVLGTTSPIDFTDFDISSDGLMTLTPDDGGDAITVTPSAAITDALDVSNTSIVNAINVGDNTILGTTTPIDFTNFDVASNGVVTITTPSTTTVTGGFLKMTMNTGNAAVDAINIAYAGNGGVATGTDLTIFNASMFQNDSDANGFGMKLTFQNAGAGAGGYEAFIRLENQDQTVGGVTDGIMIDSTSGVNGDITDGLDVSDANIINAINVGDNTIIGTTAVIDFTNFDVSSTGNIAVAGTITSSRATDLGWSVVAAANQACNTTCTNACAGGLDQGTLGAVLPSLVGCADATADQCFCAGAN